MNDTSSNETEAEKKERKLETARKIWMILTPVFAVIALLSFYNWTQGSSPSGLLSQLGMVFLGLSMIAGKRNKTLNYILLARRGDSNRRRIDTGDYGFHGLSAVNSKM